MDILYMETDITETGKVKEKGNKLKSTPITNTISRV